MDWQLLDSDRELFDRELETFVSARVFDAHAHLYELSQFTGEPPQLCARGPVSVGWDTYQDCIAQIMPRRHVGGLLFGFPNPHVDPGVANDFVAREVRRAPASRAQMVIHPMMDPELIRETVRRERFVGLKCYHFYSAVEPTFNATLPSYLPEEQVRVAHEEGLTITVHLVRPRALADPANQETIRRYAEGYPNARFILAHAARGFNPHHTVQGIRALSGLGNVWCDTSAVTECGAFEAIVRTLGVDRLLYGSDFPVSHQRGRCVAIGDSFLWLSHENTNFSAPYAEVQPTLVGIESLRALKLACMNLNLSDAEVEAIFYGNAAKLFGVDQ